MRCNVDNILTEGLKFCSFFDNNYLAEATLVEDEEMKILKRFLFNQIRHEIDKSFIDNMHAYGFNGTSPMKLWRGMVWDVESVTRYYDTFGKKNTLKKGQTLKFSDPEASSWSKDKRVSELYSRDKSRFGFGIMFEAQFQPKEIVVDVDLLIDMESEELGKSKLAQVEKEVIIAPLKNKSVKVTRIFVQTKEVDDIDIPKVLSEVQ